MESLQRLIETENHKEIIRRFDEVKERLTLSYYEFRFIQEVERYILEETNYKED